MTDESSEPQAESPWDGWQADDRPPAPGLDSLQAAVAERQLQRENHPFTLSIQVGGRDAPMLVLRAETAAELNGMITQVEMTGLWANVGSHLSSARAHGTLGAGMPGQVQAAPPQMQQPMQVTPQGIPMMPQAQFGQPLGQGGMPGQAPAQWQNAGAPAPGGCPPGWFVVDIPYAARAQGDAIKNQLKQQGMYQGNMKWDGTARKWYCSPAVAQFFAQFNPIPG